VHDLHQSIYIIKDPRFPPIYQYGYGVDEGVEILFAGGLLLGAAGSVEVVLDSPVSGGIEYRGFTGLGGEIGIGYLHTASSSDTGWGISVAFRALYAQIRKTDLYFFLPAAELLPHVTFGVHKSPAFRLGIPIRYSYRPGLVFHLSGGLAIQFLL
jgi:hypothetical protein